VRLLRTLLGMLPSLADDLHRPSWHRGVAKTAEGGVAKTAYPGVVYVTGVGSPIMTVRGRLLCRSTLQRAASPLGQRKPKGFCRGSPRRLPRRLKPWKYSDGMATKCVCRNGALRWGASKWVVVSTTLVER